MIIRPVTALDAEAINSIYNHYIAHSIATFEEELMSVGDMQQRINKTCEDGYPWLVAESDNGEILGYAYGTQWKERFSYRFVAEVTVYLAPGGEGKGVGSTLYAELFPILKERGFHSLIAVVSLPNDGSAALHEKFGMNKVGHYKEVGFKFNQWIDVGYWQLML